MRNRPKTIYSIRKEIIEIFGAFTKPSIGTIYPALKRLLTANAVGLEEIMSQGGKKSSYYSLTKSGKEYFKEVFFSSTRENPSLFYLNLQSRLGTMSMLNEEDRVRFVSEILKKVEINKFEIENQLKDEFLELDYYQTQMLKHTLEELKSLEAYIKNLKVNNDG